MDSKHTATGAPAGPCISLRKKTTFTTTVSDDGISVVVTVVT